MSNEILQERISEGFQLNEDGTIDAIDFLTFLLGKPNPDKFAERLTNQKPFNPQSVSVSELASFCNGYNHIQYVIEVRRINEILKGHNNAVRSKINDKTVDFWKMLAYFVTRPVKYNRAYGQQNAGDYEAKKALAAQKSKEASAAGRDIGELPAVVNPARKEECQYNFKRFCECYFGDTFALDWSNDHLRCIEKIEQSVLEGGLFALALPRGSGKTSLCETAAIWAISYGHRLFITIIGATETAALEILDSVKTEFETNEALAEDFPEICFPIASLEGIANRCNGQTYHGERTRITWTANELVLPTIKGSKASGIIVRVAGITGRIRGMKYKRPDGKSVRPELVIVDDPQTRESARSIEQNKNRIKILSSDILGLAGPSKKIAGVMPCTIIEPGDMADVILDKDKHPEWNGEKAKLLYNFPTNMDLWEKYAEIRGESLREFGNIQQATDFYKENQAKMDEGAVVAWKARYDHDEISAVQNAMNLYYRDASAFASEYQNEPLKENISEESILSADAIAGKLNGLPHFQVPLECNKLTMFVDVQKKCLFYTICAWSDEFSGAVIDYGTYPEQKTRRFTLNSIYPSLQDLYPKLAIEAQLYKAFDGLMQKVMDNVYVREDGLEMHVDRVAIDANWNVSTEIVYQYCRQSQYHGIIIPAHGHYVGASSRPMSEYRKKVGDKVGINWYIPALTGRRAVKHIVFDTNFWKSFVHARLSASIGESGCLTLYGTSPIMHELFSEHLTAEYRVKTAGRGRMCDEWRIRPEHFDNHWLDCTVGCAVLASSLGSVLPEQMAAVKRKPIKLSEIKEQEPIQNNQVPVFQANIPNNVAVPERRHRIKLSEILRQKR